MLKWEISGFEYWRNPVKFERLQWLGEAIWVVGEMKQTILILTAFLTEGTFKI